MFAKTIGRKCAHKLFGFAVIVTLILALSTSNSTIQFAVAQEGGNTYGAGYIENVGNIRGYRASVYATSIPDGLVWTAAPLGICQTRECYKIVETGWIKGRHIEHSSNANLHQYVVWTDQNGNPQDDHNLGDLAENSWYDLKVLYSNSAGRWEAWRGTNVVWFQYNLGWTNGLAAQSGGENSCTNCWVNVSIYHPEYRTTTGGWTLRNYTGRTMKGGACVYRAYDYGHFVYSPSTSCTPTIATSAENQDQSLPVPPPPPTPGPEPKLLPHTVENPVPITTQDEAIKLALLADSQYPVRNEPVTASLLSSNPNRVIVEQFATRQEASNKYGQAGYPDPQIASEPVWTVTIIGKATVPVAHGLDGTLRTVEVNRITYIFSQRTGELLGTRTAQ
jgi:hypothetical protein